MFKCKNCGRICSTKSGLTRHIQHCSKIKVNKRGYEYFMGKDHKEILVHRNVIEKN